MFCSLLSIPQFCQSRFGFFCQVFQGFESRVPPPAAAVKGGVHVDSMVGQARIPWADFSSDDEDELVVRGDLAASASGRGSEWPDT